MASLTGALFTGLAVIGLMSFTPLLLQRGLHLSVIGSAGVLAAWSGTSMTVALATRRLLGRVSAASVVVLGFAISAAAEFALAGLTVGSSWTRLLPGLVILGIGSGLVNASLGRLALESVPRERAGMGSGANNTARYLGGAAGVALVVALVTGGGGAGAVRAAGGVEHRGGRVRRAVRAGGADRRGVSPHAGVAVALNNFFPLPGADSLGSASEALGEKGGSPNWSSAATCEELITGEDRSHGQGWCRDDSRKDRYMKRCRAFTLTAAAVVALATCLLSVPAALGATPGAGKLGLDDPLCASQMSTCADVHGQLNGYYVGHDEPSLEFKSNIPGSGNDMTYLMTLPKDPTTQPTAFGGPNSTTWNFQLRPTFWFGLTLCDSESAPEFTKTCKPDSDSNNLIGTNPNAPNYIGKHPGNAFMELQFDGPGYVPQFEGFGCAATVYCAVLTIDSFNEDQNHGAPGSNGTPNTAACNNYVLGGPEPINWAWITTSGHSQAPANPLFTGTFDNTNFSAINPDLTKDLLMNPGDKILVHMQDTAAGFQVVLVDLTTHQSGSMTASIANGFGHVLYTPNSSTCQEAPYAFHPEYSTANVRGNTWSIHTYNVAMSDEIGHFENCLAIDANGNCTQPGFQDAGSGLDEDDSACVPGTDSTAGEDRRMHEPGRGLRRPVVPARLAGHESEPVR